MQELLPIQLAGLDTVEFLLHVVCELKVDDVGESLHHKLRDHNAEVRGLKVFAVLYDIFV